MSYTILIIDDNETIRAGLSHTIRRMGHETLTASSGAGGVELFKQNPNVAFVISDLKMDGMDGVAVLRAIRELDEQVPFMLITAFGTVETAVEAMKLGAFDFLTKPFAPEVVRLKVERALQLVAIHREKHKLEAHNEYLRSESEERYRFADIVGASDSIRKVYKTIEKVARADSSVFVWGESGTGKELVARAIHINSKRKDGPFIKVNCGALTETLLESELFGHEKGAFTGAIRTKMGRFELADEGTLFLDEIGDVPMSMQIKLLRVLQEQEFERVGGEGSIKVDVRIVSATNKNLEKEVAEGRFREDLYYRLHIIPMTLPALRDRRDDIPLLVAHFIDKLGPKTNAEIRGIADDALGRFMAYSWPGNVRELENVVEQSLVFAEGTEIQVDALPAMLQGQSGGAELSVPKEMSLPDILEDLERQLILKAYKKAREVKTETARLLGIKTSALYYKLEKYDIT